MLWVEYTMSQKIILGTDHAGFKLKETLKSFLEQEGYTIEDLGTNSEESVDYPPIMKKVAKKVAKENATGIILGGSGQGEAMTANRVKGIRATVYYGGNKDIITLSKEHNNANILSLGARFLSEKEAKAAVKLWLNTKFPQETRHIRRIKEIDQ